MIEIFGTINKTLSQAERDVITQLGEKHWIELIENGQIMVYNAFNQMAIEAFMVNKQGPATEALRRMVTAMKNMTPRRNTPEYDKLCALDV